jgi:flagellar FliJ protein
MAFRFPLQAVLQARRSYERREELRLAIITAYLHQLRREFEDLSQQKIMTHRRLTERLREGMIACQYQFEMASMAAIAERQRLMAIEIAKAERRRAAQERAYREAQKSRKTLENLRDRQWAAYRQVQLRRDQQQVDDLFAIRLAFRDEPVI